jgi:hypothetical protein
MDSKKMSKSARIREQLAKGLTSDGEIAAIVGCTKTLVSVIKSAYKRGQSNKPKTKRFVSRQLALKNKPLTPSDMVNSPSHYTTGGIEVYDFIAAKGLSYELGNVVKYVSRAGHKGNKLEDLKKAQWYLNAAISREESV